MDVRQGARELSEALVKAGLGGHFEGADAEEVDEVFAELRELGLEPSSALGAFYRQADPLSIEVRPWVHEGLRLLSLRELASAHVGYAWDEGGRRVEAWRSRWIIVAKAGADPYFVDATHPGMPVFTDTFGAGAWQPQRVASSLGVLLAVCARWTRLCVSADPRALPWPTFMAALAALDPEAAESEFWAEAQALR